MFFQDLNFSQEKKNLAELVMYKTSVITYQNSELNLKNQISKWYLEWGEKSLFYWYVNFAYKKKFTKKKKFSRIFVTLRPPINLNILESADINS